MYQASRNLKKCQCFSCLNVQSLHRVNFDFHVHARPLYVVFSTALLYALILHRVILVQHFDSYTTGQECREGRLRGCIFIFMCKKLEEHRRSPANKLKVLHHKSFLL